MGSQLTFREAAAGDADGPRADADRFSGEAYGSLRDAWRGYKIAITEGNTAQAKQYAAIINGIRAGAGLEPIAFDRLDGFTGVEDGVDLAEARADALLGEGDRVPRVEAPAHTGETVAVDASDAIVFFMPNTSGCRCSAQARELEQVRQAADVQVYAVTNDDPDALADMADDLGLGYPLLSDADGSLALAFGVPTADDGTPDRVTFFARDGEVVERVEGMFHIQAAEHNPAGPSMGAAWQVNTDLSFDGTTTDEWTEPDLRDWHVDGQFWSDLSDADKLTVASYFVLWRTGDPSAGDPPTSYDDLKLPVVNTVGNLSLPALRNAKARAGQVEGVGQGTVREVKRYINQLAEENFNDAEFTDVGGDGSPPEIVEHVEHPGVYVISGRRGGGKSSLAMYLGEQMARHEGVTPATVGMPEPVRESFPDDWVHVDVVDDAPPDAVIVVDEAYAQFHARDANTTSNTDMSKLVNLSRHCQRTLLFVVQNTAHLDRNAISEADGLLMKEPGTFQMEFERRQFRELSERAKQSFQQLPSDQPVQAYTYVVTDNTQDLVPNDETSWYDDDVSRSFAGMCNSVADADDEADDAADGDESGEKAVAEPVCSDLRASAAPDCPFRRV